MLPVFPSHVFPLSLCLSLYRLLTSTPTSLLPQTVLSRQLYSRSLLESTTKIVSGLLEAVRPVPGVDTVQLETEQETVSRRFTELTSRAGQLQQVRGDGEETEDVMGGGQRKRREERTQLAVLRLIFSFFVSLRDISLSL